MPPVVSEPAVGPGPRIVDAHFHLWNLDENDYPWLRETDGKSLVGDVSGLRRNYLVSDYLRDVGSLDVVAGVHIQAEHDHRDPVRETRWLQRVADAPESHGFPQAIVADADFTRDDVDAILERHCAFANTRGIRHALHRRLDESPPYDPLLDPAWARNFPLLRKHGLSFDLQLFPRQAPAALALIRANPDVQFILTHAAMPFARDAEGMALWRRSIREYAALANVAIKISGFGGYDPAWSAESVDGIVSAVVDAFTPARCMLASNYPVEGLVKRYADIWNVFARYFAVYSAAERDLLFWQNAVRIYRLKIS
jgi:predicted TIM-barrel fold metal-dependent hydrolase